MAEAMEERKERYLSFWLAMNRLSPKVCIYLPQNTQVQGIYKATDSENNRLRIDQLQTTMGIYERCVIRGTDVDMLEFQLP